MENNKKLYRSRDRKLAGVCGGIADYFNLDTSLVRILYAVLSLCTTGFPGLLIYIIMAIVVPNQDDN